MRGLLTVGELIKALEEFDADAKVNLNTYDVAYKAVCVEKGVALLLENGTVRKGGVVVMLEEVGRWVS